MEARLRSDKRGWLPPEQWTEYGLTAEQARFYQQPSEADMAAIGLQRLFYSDYTPWSNNHHLHVALNIVGGFQTSAKCSPGTFTFGYSTDDDLYDAYIWMLWPKFGFGRATKYTSKDIQEGKISRAEAIELVRDHDGEFPWQAFERFCEKTGMSEEDLWGAIERSVGDAENLSREASEFGGPMKIRHGSVSARANGGTAIRSMARNASSNFRCRDRSRISEQFAAARAGRNAQQHRAVRRNSRSLRRPCRPGRRGRWCGDRGSANRSQGSCRRRRWRRRRRCCPAQRGRNRRAWRRARCRPGC